MLAGGTARRRGQQGTAALEFAILAPVVLYLLLGLITYGWLLSFRQTLSQGSAEGARAAAVAPAGYTSAQLRTTARGAVSDALSTYSMTCDSSGSLLKSGSAVGTCTVTVASCTNDSSSQCVTVALDYNYSAHPLIPLPGMNVVTPSHVTYSSVAQVNS